MDSIPVGDSNFFFVPRSWKLYIPSFSFFSELKFFHLSFFISHTFSFQGKRRFKVETQYIFGYFLAKTDKQREFPPQTEQLDPAKWKAAQNELLTSFHLNGPSIEFRQKTARK